METAVTEKNNNVSGRSIEIITSEIKDIRRQAQAMALIYAVEIGRRLEEAKLMLPHGKWGDWLEKEVEFSQSTAENYMRLFDEYGAAQISIFGASVNSQSLASLPYSKALQLLAVPKEEREKFAKEVKAEDLSVKELQSAIKERDEARAKEQKALENAKREKDRADGLQRDMDAAKKEAYEEALNKAKAENKKQIEKAQADLASEKMKATAAENEKNEALELLRIAEGKLKTASVEVTAFKTLFDQMQMLGGKLKGMVAEVAKTDKETADKLSAALKAFGASL